MDRYHFSKQEQSLLEGMQIPFAIFQLVDQRIVTLVVSNGFCELMGSTNRPKVYEAMDHDTYRYVHPDDIARLGNAVFRFMKDGGRFECVYRLKKQNESGYLIIHAYGEHIYTDEGVRLAQIWYADEGAYEGEREESGLSQSLSNALHEESVLRATYYDFLTGLPSMTYFFELAEAGKETILQEGDTPVLLYMDFGGMKFYNTKHGFAEGDNLLRAFARLLIDTFGMERCCRISSDHFAAQTEKTGLEERLQKLLSEYQKLNHGQSLPLRVGVYPREEDVHTSVACDRAKLACSALKGRYGTAVNYYDQELSKEAERKQYIIENLDRAIEEAWIKVYYQPIVRAVNGKVCDEEALARWIDPEAGFLSPADFIPALEESGLIYKLDLYVLERVLEKMADQAASGLHIVPHSINLSRSDFNVCDIVEEIRRRVDATSIGRELITIEITESIIGSDFDFMKEQIERFRSLGFPVWLDDFGSGYSSMDVLQSIQFDLIKFDMSFMQKLDEGENGKIVLTELMKMATSLNVDTVCEGVEKESQVRFLQEIGCSKLQGFYYCKPIPPEEIIDRYRKGIQIGFENPDESSYFEAIGRLNIYDLGVIANEENTLQNAFDTIPIGIMEIHGEQAKYIRYSRSFRAFYQRFFDLDIAGQMLGFGDSPVGYGPAFLRMLRRCCEAGNRAFFDEIMGDGSKVHAFVRRIGTNPVSGNIAVAVAVLSISEPEEETSYADIARALAADYYNIYVVDLDTDRYIEYTSQVGEEELAVERHGEDFFESSKRDAHRIYEEDQEIFYAAFSKEQIIQALDSQGVFTTTYRLMDTGTPVYVNMKVTRMQPGSNRIIIGISIIDSQMKKKEELERIQRERDALARIMALSEDYLSLYSVDPDTGGYVEYSSSDEYDSLGLAKTGEDFFQQAVINVRGVIHPEDLSGFLERFNRENIMAEIHKDGAFNMNYRLVIQGQAKHVSLKIVPFREGSKEMLVAGVRAWRTRRQCQESAGEAKWSTENGSH